MRRGPGERGSPLTPRRFRSPFPPRTLHGRREKMKVVITGATGNVGTSTVEALSQSSEIDEIVGLARREPAWRPPKTSWLEANVLSDDLVAAFAGADAVIHL